MLVFSLFSQDRQDGKPDGSVSTKGELVMQVPQQALSPLIHSKLAQGCGGKDRVWVLEKHISPFAFSSYHTRDCISTSRITFDHCIVSKW